MKKFERAVVATLLIVAPVCLGAEPQGQSAVNTGLEEMLAKYAEAATLFYNGQPDAVKALWSHADDVTLSGAAGGATAKGWKEVGERLDWASSQFSGSRGTKAVDKIQSGASGDFAYIVQYEHIRYHPREQAEEARRDYRVTTIFRHETSGWRVVHRHADTLMTRQDIR